MRTGQTMYGGHIMFCETTTEDKAHPIERGYAVGLDPSLTSFGVYCLPLGHDEWYGWSLQSIAEGASDVLRILSMTNDLILSMGQLPYPVRIATMEDYGPINRTSGKIAQRAEMCGILKSHFILQLKVPVVTVPPTALKSFATGNARSSKEQIVLEAERQGFHPNNHDEADAYFAARLGRNILRGVKVGVSYVRTNPL